MHTFISKLCDEIVSTGRSYHDINIVVPGRRAALFIKKELAGRSSKPMFSPCIYTIEDLAEEMAHLHKADMTTLLFEFYGVYRHVCGEDKCDTFDVFSRWASTLLSDFNEIDRYMLSPNDVFATLMEVERIEGWDLEMPLSPLMQSHKNFWKLAQKLYEALKDRLLSLGLGYQGMIFRRAGENAGRSATMQMNNGEWFFAGLNAMSVSEENIVRYFLKEKNARLYTQSDKYYMREGHSAGVFLRRIKKDPLLGRNFLWEWDQMNTPKKCDIIGVSKKVGQSKVAASILKNKMQEDPHLEDTALVLADEKQLIPMLSSLPEGVSSVNVTMGYPLSALPAAGWGDAVIDLYATPERLHLKGFYHKDVVALVRQNLCVKWLMTSGVDYSSMVCDYIVKTNAVDFHMDGFIQWMKDTGKKCDKEAEKRLYMLLGERTTSPRDVCQKIINIIDTIKEEYTQYDDMSMEYMYHTYSIFVTIKDYMDKYPYVENISTLRTLYHQLSGGETVDFYGEPLEGLQLMGLLETRLLNFKNIIITGVNEGVLPAGRSENTFIPYDVKRFYGLPTYSEKDAIYSYHFFRLMQGAENITVIYDVDEGSGGVIEPSRFVQQMKHDLAAMWDIKEITMSIAPESLPDRCTRVEKTQYAIKRTREILEKGISPSALTSYMTSPMEFYYKRVLNIGDEEKVDETAAANTMGSIIHQVLQVLYTPFIGQELTVKDIEIMRGGAEKEIKAAFDTLLTGRDYSTGPNYLAWQAVRRMVYNYLSCQMSEIKNGMSIKPLSLESELETSLMVGDVQVKLKGIVDRVDMYNGELRVVDYKTGMVKENELKISDMIDLSPSCIDENGEEYVFSGSKAFQLLFYGYVWGKQQNTEIKSLSIGVESLRKPKDGCMMFSLDGRETLTPQDMAVFEERLKDIISQMMDITIPYTEHGTIYYDIVS